MDSGDKTQKKWGHSEVQWYLWEVTFLPKHWWWQLWAEAGVCLRTRAKISKHLVCWAFQQAIQQFCQLFLSAAQEESSQSQLGLSGIRGPQVLQHTLTQGTKQPSPPSFIPTNRHTSPPTNCSGHWSPRTESVMIIRNCGWDNVTYYYK